MANEDTLEIRRYDGESGAQLDSIFVPTSYGRLLWMEVGQDGSIYASVRPESSDGRILRLDGYTGEILDEVVLGRDGWSTHIADNDIVYVAGNGAGPIVDRLAPGSFAGFEVSISSPSAQPIGVNFASSGVTATANSDYSQVNSTLTFEPGVTSRTILVPSIDDLELEGTETFNVNLSNPTGGAELADHVGEGQIVDDDSSREFSISPGVAFEGNNELQFIDRFVADGSGGLLRTRLSTMGPDANGDGQDDLYVASADTNQILVYDGVSGAFIGPFADVLDPLDLQFSPIDGNLYVSSFGGFEVVRFNGQTGAYIDTPIAGLPDSPWGLTFTDDGTLYVAVAGDTDEVLKYDGSFTDNVHQLRHKWTECTSQGCFWARWTRLCEQQRQRKQRKC